jgi:hypothetical protein
MYIYTYIYIHIYIYISILYLYIGDVKPLAEIIPVQHIRPVGIFQYKIFSRDTPVQNIQSAGRQKIAGRMEAKAGRQEGGKCPSPRSKTPLLPPSQTRTASQTRAVADQKKRAC